MLILSVVVEHFDQPLFLFSTTLFSGLCRTENCISQTADGTVIALSVTKGSASPGWCLGVSGIGAGGAPH